MSSTWPTFGVKLTSASVTRTIPLEGRCGRAWGVRARSLALGTATARAPYFVATERNIDDEIAPLRDLREQLDVSDDAR